MRRTLINTPEDCDWLRDTALRHYHGPMVAFAAAVIDGNEDCPDAIELYACAEPFVTDGCMRLRYDSTTGRYIR